MMYTETIKLESVITDIAAGPFGSNLKVSCFVDYGFPIIDGANLKGFKVTDNVTKFVTEEKARSLHRSIAKRNDVIVTISGTLGQIAYIPENSMFEEYLCSQRQFRVSFDTERVFVPYLVYYFHSREGQHKILSFANQTGVPALSQPLKNFRNIEVDLPDIDTQKQIASVMLSLDNKIELNTAINENLEQQAQAYFVDLFITNANPNWRIGTISDLGNVVGGGTPSKKVEEYYTSDGIAWITPKDLSNDKSKFVAQGETDITELGLSKSSATLMPKGTVLFSSRAPIGYIAIADGQVCTNQGFKSIVPLDNVGTAFVYYFLKENLSAIENVASGSTFKEVSGGTMKSFTAIIPDNDTLAEFQRFCSPLFEQQRALEYENRYLASIRDTLLPKLMNGEIDVSAVKI
ncbi:MAG: restriction endonuclease subunit S [[Eubacterium] siraeum]|nr:restriction endonuclease subunit S [[Eubacterium] siraeum]